MKAPPRSVSAAGQLHGQPFSASATLTVTSAVVTTLQITPVATSLPLGLHQHFIAIATLSDGTTRNLTDDPALSWASSAPAVATISSSQVTDNGLATGMSLGSVTITASGQLQGQPFSASTALTVTDAVVTALQITPVAASLPVGLHQHFIAIATLTDGTTRNLTDDSVLNWASSAPTVATISSSQVMDNGLATGVSEGSATISAAGQLHGHPFSASTTLTVTDAVVTTLQITPVAASLPVGLHQHFTAIATLTDGTTRNLTDDSALSWASSTPDVATISSSQVMDNGLATGVSEGSVTISASGQLHGQPFSASTTLTVTDAVVASLQLTPLAATLPLGLSQHFIAIATLSDGTSRNLTDDSALSWTSSTPTVATISSSQIMDNGLATGVNQGSVTISATGQLHGHPFSASTTLTVTGAVVTALLLSPALATVPDGHDVRYTATVELSDGSILDISDQATLSWSSSDPSIATTGSGVNKGLVTGVNIGVATILASYHDATGVVFNETAQLTVTNTVITEFRVTPASTTIPKGLTQQYTAIAVFSDGRTLDVTKLGTVNWNSSNLQSAVITTEGLVTGVGEGSAVISATEVNNGITWQGAGTLTIAPAEITRITLSPTTCTDFVNFTCAFTVQAELSDTTSTVLSHDILTWDVNPKDIGILHAGRMTLLKEGQGTVTARINSQGQLLTAQAAVNALPSTTIKVVKTGLGLGIGSLGLACLGDGFATFNYDSRCVGYSLGAPNFGWVADQTFFTIRFPEAIKLNSISNIGYWRQNPVGSLGNWVVVACQDNTDDCTQPLTVSSPTLYRMGSIAFQTGATIDVTTSDRYEVYSIRYVGGQISRNGGSGTGTFSELFYDISH